MTTQSLIATLTGAPGVWRVHEPQAGQPWEGVAVYHYERPSRSADVWSCEEHGQLFLGIRPCVHIEAARRSQREETK